MCYVGERDWVYLVHVAEIYAAFNGTADLFVRLFFRVFNSPCHGAEEKARTRICRTPSCLYFIFSFTYLGTYLVAENNVEGRIPMFIWMHKCAVDLQVKNQK